MKDAVGHVSKYTKCFSHAEIMLHGKGAAFVLFWTSTFLGKQA